MAGLAALSNFTGTRNDWKGLVSRYNLKWNGHNDWGDLVGLLYSNRFDEMANELRTALEAVPADYSNYFVFNLLVGLRPSESVKAVNMLRTSPTYLNKELGVLEHFRYPRSFSETQRSVSLALLMMNCWSLP